GQPVDVWCFTNADSVRLSLNGADLGEKRVERYGHAEWSVPYEPGALDAVGLKDGRPMKRARIATTGEPAQLRLAPDRREILANGKDLCVFTVFTIDADRARDETRIEGPCADGLPAVDDPQFAVPTASNDVYFEIGGPGRIIGVGNGDPSSHERDCFVPRTISQKIENWKMAPTSGFPEKPPAIAELEGAGGTVVDIAGAAGSIHGENAFACYWARFTVAEGDLRAGMSHLSIGQIDDHGRVFLNGTLLGETHDWELPHGLDVAKVLKPGENDLIIIVKNDRGPGGLGKGVRLTGGLEWPRVHRKLFNGFCQVIVQSTSTPGVIRLRAKAEGLGPAEADVSTTEAIDGKR
ncbi:MAG TPA: DUF4982 domain-containing protein, partial [Phycisphaerae bacterium]|nr:DUF4982 domain-containing protein [Phycisphaerae bacterium]